MQNERIGLANAAQIRAGNFQRHRFGAAEGKEQGVIIARATRASSYPARTRRPCGIGRRVA